jgi:hypothetical protein
VRSAGRFDFDYDSAELLVLSCDGVYDLLKVFLSKVGGPGPGRCLPDQDRFFGINRKLYNKLIRDARVHARQRARLIRLRLFSGEYRSIVSVHGANLVAELLQCEDHSVHTVPQIVRPVEIEPRRLGAASNGEHKQKHWQASWHKFIHSSLSRGP